MPQPGLLQRPADEAHIVAGAVAAAGLHHGQGQMVGVVFAGEHRVHQLAHGDDGGIAGVVVDVLQARIDGGAVVVVQHDHVVAIAAEDGRQQVEVERAHPGGQNGVACLVHGLGELCPVVGGGLHLGEDALLLPHVHGSQQAANADAGRAQAVHLVDLQHRVQLAGALQDLADLVGGHRVQAAAEGVELNQLQILPRADKFRRPVQPGMVHPLIGHAQGMLGGEILGDAVLGEHRQAVGGHQLGDAMVDFRVNVVGTARQHDAPATGLRHPVEGLAPIAAHVRLGGKLLLPRRMDGGPAFPFGDVPLLPEEAHQPVGGYLLAGQGQEGLQQTRPAAGDVLHVVVQVLGRRRHHRAVVVILRLIVLLMLIEHAGVENGGHALADQPLHMAVGQLGGVAFALRGDGLHAQLIDGAAGQGRNHHPEAEPGQQGCPEGVVLEEVQHPGNADHAAGRFVLGQGVVGKETVQLLLHHIRALVGGSRCAQALFAPVAGDVAPSAAKVVHRQHAVVGAALAAGRTGGVRQGENVLNGQRGGSLTGIARPGDQRRAEGPHDAGDVRADGFHAGQLLKGPQDGLVVEGAALHHHMAAQIGSVRQLDDLEQGVLDDRAGQPGGDVLDGCTLLLGLLDVGIHENGAAGAQIHRRLGEKGLGGEALGGVAQGCGEVLQEGAAPGGAGLVEHNGVHRAVLELDAFHVLPADVQHAVHLRVEEGGGRGVGDGFHLALIQAEGGLEQALAVAGGAGAGDAGRGRHPVGQLLHGMAGGFHRVALIAGIEGVEQLALCADEGQLGGGGACVDAQEAIPGVGRQVAVLHPGLIVAAQEHLIFLMVAEQGRKPLQPIGHHDAVGEMIQQLVDGDGGRIAGGQGRAGCGKQMAVLRDDGGFIRQMQRADKGLPQLIQEVQRAAQEGHMPADRLAAGQAGDGLVDHRLEDGRRQIRPGRAFVDQRLNIRLGKHAAAGGDGVQLLVIPGQVVQAGGVGFQQGGHLVDKGSGAAGAHAVHAFLKGAGKVDDLRVLAAQLDGNIGLGRGYPERGGHGHNLLHEAASQGLAQGNGAGAGHGHTQKAGAQQQAGLAHHLCEGFLGLGAMAAVFAIQNLTRVIQDYQFDGGGADVNTGTVDLHGHAISNLILSVRTEAPPPPDQHSILRKKASRRSSLPVPQKPR